MTQHDPMVSLSQMRDHAREALDLVAGRGRGDLDADRVRTLALVRLLEIVGEAANRVPSQERATYPAIPWSQIIGLRNRLIHAYDHVDLDILWQILTKHLPPLVAELDAILPFNDRPA
ncbi:MAG: hypothetical protein AMS14_01405 [Planctomycetes bacterium DG_20]|nr:MAG: hypothetical protein AMS14_01405 [Planctomycetes bacterium DG_20]